MKRSWVFVMISIGVALGGLLLVMSANAAGTRTAQASPTITFAVNTTLDEVDDNPGNGVCHTATNHCSLRAAVMEANNGSGATIIVPAGTYTLTLSANGDLEMRKDITLIGAGPNLTIIQGNPAGWTDRILRIRNDAKATVNGVTIRYGHAVNDLGGGIYVVTGTLTLNNSVVESNTAEYTGGGGIYNNDQLTLTESSILSNSVGGQFGYYGGGIYNAAGSRVYLTRTLIQGNVSWGGTGFYNDSGGQAYLNFSTISSNHAITGGGAGLWNNGTANLIYVTLTNNLAAEQGGGVYNGVGANAIIVDPFILHNTSSAGGGIYTDMTSTLILASGSVSSNTANAGPGGGLYNNERAQSTIIAVDISHNQAQGLYGDGSGVFSYGRLLINASNISNNTGHYGGGVASSGGLTLTQSTVANNSALAGGGLNFNGSGGYVDRSTISGNQAVEGGGIEASGDFTDKIEIDNSTINSNTSDYGGGAGIRNSVHLYLTNDTVSDNQTQGSGGGIYNVTGVIDVLNNVTIAHNTADSNHDGFGDGGGLYNEPGRGGYFYNSLIAGNIDTGGQAPDCGGGELTSEDYNLIHSTLGCTITGTTTHNITGKNPLLGPLQNNGGSTWTRALLPGSPAIDAGSPDPINWACASSDQRGVARPIGPRCDIGAFEAPPTLTVYLPLILR
jgi:CSLREA domain-containing protein